MQMEVPPTSVCVTVKCRSRLLEKPLLFRLMMELNLLLSLEMKLPDRVTLNVR